MIYPTTPAELIQFIDTNWTFQQKGDCQYKGQLQLSGKNKDMAPWVFQNAQSLFAKLKTPIMHRKYLGTCQSDEMIRFLSTNKRSPVWMMAPMRESRIHYFWLSENNCESAVKLISDRFHNPVDPSIDNGSDVWLCMMCSNTNPAVLQLIFDTYGSIPEECKVFDIEGSYPQSPNMLHLGFLAANPTATNWVIETLWDQYFTSSNTTHALIWKGLSQNPHPLAIQLLEQHPLRADLDGLALNPNKAALNLMQSIEPSSINWNWGNLSRNPAAIHLLQRNDARIDYCALASNPHPWAISEFAKWSVSKNWSDYNRKALGWMLRSMFRYNFRDAYRHQWVDF
jgi:hypothetical protein